MHDMIRPLAWLLGKWRAEGGGKGQYPTIKTFEYGEEVEFFHVGQPNVQFSLYSWHAESRKPLHREVGFIRIKPDSNKIALMSAHNFGVADIQEGEVKDNELKVETAGIHRMSFSPDPETKKLSRTFQRKGDKMEQVMYMETSNTPLTEHLRITYSKIE
ncbi:peroxynitrite isomerase THAP4-like isoform X2 [Littorina saxatilis]